jgi:hypothetical protein
VFFPVAGSVGIARTGRCSPRWIACTMIVMSRIELPSGNFRGSLLHEGRISDVPSSN